MHNTHDFGGGARRGGKNKQWVASAMDQPLSSGSGGRPRGSHGHGKGRGGGGLKNNGYHSEPDEVKPTSSKPASPYEHLENTVELDDPVFAPLFVAPEDEPANQTMEEKEAVYKDLVHLWELEAKVAVRTGKMSSEKGDIHNPITMAGTCMHMCSRRERYRREREFNLEVWEQLPGTRYVDHPHAVTKYERARGDKVTPSDLRPLPILKATMDYMLQDLMSRGGFEATHSFIRDRTRQIRADLTIQRLASPVVLECIERCMRFHILAFRKMRDDKSFDKPTETGLLSNCTQSLKELYNDLRDESEFGPAYAFPCEVEMWIYRCLIFIRNQGPEQIPPQIQAHPLYKLAVQFRSHVQSASGTITRSSELKVGGQGMATFQQLVEKLLETEDGRPMVFMVACLLDSIFGTGTVKEIDDLREGYTDLDLIVRAEPSEADEQVDEAEEEEEEVEVEDETEEAMEGEEEGVTEQDVDDMESDLDDEALTVAPETVSTSTFLPPVTASAFPTASSSSGFPPSASAFPNSSISPLTANAFTKITSTSNVFGNRSSAFGNIGAGNAFTAIAASSSRPNGSLFGSPSTRMNSSPFSSANGTSTLPTPASAAPVTNSFGGGGTNTTSDPLNPKAPEFVPSFGHLTNMPPPALPVPMQPQAIAPVAPAAPSQPIHQPQPAKPIFGVSSTGLASYSSGPVLPQIDTSLTIKINGPITPINPPALEKVQPVSLPSTPTAPPLQSGFFNLTAGLGEPLIQPMKTGNRLLASLRTDLAPSAGMLSPLVMTPSSTPLRTSFSPTKQISPPDRKGKGKATDIDLETQAREFESRGLLVRESFKRWQKLATDHAEWIAACQRGERYSATIRSRRYGRSLRDDDEESSASMSVTPTKRRRQRTYQPRKTDDELLSRFEEVCVCGADTAMSQLGLEQGRARPSLGTGLFSPDHTQGAQAQKSMAHMVVT
ncbi:unnamed protein product [Mycena citricolor]|uniref:SAC3/GANP/THP3 conserved domain-containing protein n=1 Tax=Mycena citricolor TaxID=2018698 RepID=A0AAD2K0Q7_9AGAR|nr:unnamed protein product [Mycena citricolor]